MPAVSRGWGSAATAGTPGLSFHVNLHLGFFTASWTQGSNPAGKRQCTGVTKCVYYQAKTLLAKESHKAKINVAYLTTRQDVTGSQRCKNTLQEGTPGGPPHILGLGGKETKEGKTRRTKKEPEGCKAKGAREKWIPQACAEPRQEWPWEWMSHPSPSLKPSSRCDNLEVCCCC